MSQPSDLTKIRGLVAHARTRIPTQGALEAATTAVIAARAAPRANVAAATPYTTPKDLRMAVVFVVVAVLVALLRINLPHYTPSLTGVTPLFAPPSAEVTLHGKNLTVGVKRRPVTASVQAQAGTVLGVAGATAEADSFVPANVNVYLGVVVNGASVSGGIPLDIERWSKDTIVVRLPADAPFGKTTLTAFIAGKPTN